MSPPVSAMKTSATILVRSPGCSSAAPGQAKRFHRLLDPLIEACDVGTVGVDPVQEQPGHERVMGGEPADSAPRSTPGSSTASGVWPDRRSPPDRVWPSISASSIARPDTPVMSVATEDSLIPASSSSFSSRCTSRVRSRVIGCGPGSDPAAPGSVPAARTTP